MPPLHISLIGMSNIGKSYWSRRLAATGGYERVDCDTLLEAKLGEELKKFGYKGIHDVAAWMGQPYDARYAETSRKYLTSEREVMLEVLARLRDKPDKPLVIDTTGSIIYTGDDIITALRELTRVVYFEATAAHTAKLFQRYLSNPKPVIWGNIFASETGEKAEAALQRCYPKLLQFRAERYRAMAHISVPFEKHKTPGISWEELIAAA